MRISFSIDLNSMKVGLELNVNGTDTPVLVAEAETEVYCVAMGMEGVELDGRSEAYGLGSVGSADLRKVACGGESSTGTIFDSFCEESGAGCCRGFRCRATASLLDCSVFPPKFSLDCW